MSTLTSLQELQLAAMEDAAKEEREAVVAYLRRMAEERRWASAGSVSLRLAATSIERGEHLPGEKA